jgi:hypothetical protein
MTSHTTEDQIESLLEKPFWVIDFLPEQVSAERSKQYFAVDEYFCKSQYINLLYQKFAYLIIKLSCYFDIDGNPSPEDIFDHVKESTTKGYMNFLFPNDNVLITLNGGDLYMTVYNPNERFLQLLQRIATSEGLFLRNNLTTN